MSGLFKGILLGAGGALGVCSQSESLNDVPRFILKSALAGYDKISLNHTSSQTPGSTTGSDSAISQSAELQALSKQIAELKASNANKSIVVYGGSSSSGIAKIVVITTTGVVICWYFGYGFNDVMYVTKSTLNKAIKAVEGQVEYVGVKLEKAKTEIFGKISSVEKMIFSSSKDLETKIDSETGKIRVQIQELDGKFYGIETSQHDIKGTTNKMNSRLGNLEAKFDANGRELEKANSGIKLLISSVMDLPHVQQNRNLMFSLKNFVSGYTSNWFAGKDDTKFQRKSEEDPMEIKN